MHHFEIVEDFMHVMDEDGNGCDAHVLRDHGDAKCQLERWAAEYAFDVAEACRQVEEYFSRGTAR